MFWICLVVCVRERTAADSIICVVCDPCSGSVWWCVWEREQQQTALYVWCVTHVLDLSGGVCERENSSRRHYMCGVWPMFWICLVVCVGERTAADGIICVVSDPCFGSVWWYVWEREQQQMALYVWCVTHVLDLSGGVCERENSSRRHYMCGVWPMFWICLVVCVRERTAADGIICVVCDPCSGSVWWCVWEREQQQTALYVWCVTHVLDLSGGVCERENSSRQHYMCGVWPMFWICLVVCVRERTTADGIICVVSDPCSGSVWWCVWEREQQQTALYVWCLTHVLDLSGGVCVRERTAADGIICVVSDPCSGSVWWCVWEREQQQTALYVWCLTHVLDLSGGVCERENSSRRHYMCGVWPMFWICLVVCVRERTAADGIICVVSDPCSGSVWWCVWEREQQQTALYVWCLTHVLDLSGGVCERENSSRQHYMCGVWPMFWICLVVCVRERTAADGIICVVCDPCSGSVWWCVWEREQQQTALYVWCLTHVLDLSGGVCERENSSRQHYMCGVWPMFWICLVVCVWEREQQQTALYVWCLTHVLDLSGGVCERENSSRQHYMCGVWPMFWICLVVCVRERTAADGIICVVSDPCSGSVWWCVWEREQQQTALYVWCLTHVLDLSGGVCERENSSRRHYMCGVWPMFWICLVVCVRERTAADGIICVMSDPCSGSVWWCVWEREQQQTALYVWCVTHVLDLSGGVCGRENSSRRHYMCGVWPMFWICLVVCERENSSRRHYMCGVWPMFWICLVVCVRERTAADGIICVVCDPCSGSVWWCVWEREQQQTALYVWCLTHVLDLSGGVCERENSSRQHYMCGVWPMFWICLVVCVWERTAADSIICVVCDPCSGSVWWCVWEREQQQTALYVWCVTHVLDLSGGVCERENSSRQHYMCGVWPMFWICLVVCVRERTAADGIICVVSDPCSGSVWWCVWEREQQQTALYVWCLTHVLDLSGGVCERENSSRRHYMCGVWPMFWICLVVCVGERTAADGIICVVSDPCSGSVWWCVWEREQQQTALYVWCLTHVLDLSGGVCVRENSSRQHYMCGVWPMFWICLVVCVGERTAADGIICVVSDPCSGSVWWCVCEREQQQTALYVWCLTHVLDLSGGVCGRENSSRRHYMCGVWPMFWICLVVCVGERTAADGIICVVSDPCSGSVWWCVWEREQQQTALYVWCLTHVLDLSGGVCERENSSRRIICVVSDPCFGSVWWCAWEREQQQTALYVWCLTHVLDLSGGVCERENSSRRHYMCGVWPMFWICLVVCVRERTAADGIICVVSDPCSGSVWWCVWEREQQQTALYVWCLTHVLDLSGGVCEWENSSRRHYMCGVWPMFWICLVVCLRERTAADGIICVVSDPCSGSVWWCVWEREQQQTALYVWCVTHVLDLSGGVCERENSSRRHYMCGVWPMFWICLVVCVRERTAADGIICVVCDPCSGSVWWCVWEREQQQTALYVWCVTHVLDLSGGVCERENSSRRHYMCGVWPMFWICLVVCVRERTAADSNICVVCDPCSGSVWWCVWEREQQQTALYVWCLTHVLDLSGGVCERENSSRRHYMCGVWPMFWICLVVCVRERTAADGIICVVSDQCFGSVWWCVWEREQQQTALYVWYLTHVLDLSGGVCKRENSSRRHYMCGVWPMFWICLVVCVGERTAADGIICVVSDPCFGSVWCCMWEREQQQTALYVWCLTHVLDLSGGVCGRENSSRRHYMCGVWPMFWICLVVCVRERTAADSIICVVCDPCSGSVWWCVWEREQQQTALYVWCMTHVLDLSGGVCERENSSRRHYMCGVWPMFWICLVVCVRERTTADGIICVVSDPCSGSVWWCV